MYISSSSEIVYEVGDYAVFHMLDYANERARNQLGFCDGRTVRITGRERVRGKFLYTILIDLYNVGEIKVSGAWLTPKVSGVWLTPKEKHRNFNGSTPLCVGAEETESDTAEEVDSIEWQKLLIMET